MNNDANSNEPLSNPKVNIETPLFAWIAIFSTALPFVMFFLLIVLNNCFPEAPPMNGAIMMPDDLKILTASYPNRFIQMTRSVCAAYIVGFSSNWAFHVFFMPIRFGWRHTANAIHLFTASDTRSGNLIMWWVLLFLFLLGVLVYAGSVLGKPDGIVLYLVAAASVISNQFSIPYVENMRSQRRQ
jgi:magnesium-transporting ATPase (P-type)